MDQNRSPVVTRSLTRLPSRRQVLRGLAGSGVALGWPPLATPTWAKPRKKRRRNKSEREKGALCTRSGRPCNTPGNSCQERYCLSAPFTIEAQWTESTSAHDTFLFVPPSDGTTGPSPYINFSCNRDDSTCENAYPFACVSRDAGGAESEITTVHRLLRGGYQYWIELYESTPADELTVALKESGGRVVRQWSNPANATNVDVGWHVFDVDADGRVTSIDDPIDVNLPIGAHNPNTNVCPYDPTAAAAASNTERPRPSTRL